MSIQTRLIPSSCGADVSSKESDRKRGVSVLQCGPCQWLLPRATVTVAGVSPQALHRAGEGGESASSFLLLPSSPKGQRCGEGSGQQRPTTHSSESWSTHRHFSPRASWLSSRPHLPPRDGAGIHGDISLETVPSPESLKRCVIWQADSRF